MKITLADFVGTASAEPQLVSLSAVNIKLTTSRLKALEAKIERMKKKPQTEARKKRIKEAKETAKKYTADLKVAQKELKSGDKKPAKGKTAAKPETESKKTVGEHTQKVRDRKAAMQARLKKLLALPKTEANQKKIVGLRYDIKNLSHAMGKAVQKDRDAAQKSKAAGNPDAIIKKIQRLREALVLNRAEIIGDQFGKKRDALNRKRHNMQLDLQEALKAAKAAKIKVPKDDTIRKPIKQKRDRHDEW